MASMPPLGPTPGDAMTSTTPGMPLTGASAVSPELDDAAAGPGGLSGMGSGLGSSTGSYADTAKDQVRYQAQSLRDQATTRARDTAEQGKTRAVGLLDDVADQVHEVAGKLRQGQAAPLAQYVEQLAGSLGGFAATIRDKPIDAILDDVRIYARHNPAVAVGGALALGFVLARFMKATAPANAAYDRY